MTTLSATTVARPTRPGVIDLLEKACGIRFIEVPVEFIPRLHHTTYAAQPEGKPFVTVVQNPWGVDYHHSWGVAVTGCHKATDDGLVAGSGSIEGLLADPDLIAMILGNIGAMEYLRRREERFRLRFRRIARWGLAAAAAVVAIVIPLVALCS